MYDLFCLFKDAFGHWSGIVGELVRHEADIGVASLTISSVRQKAVDFSTPFMNLGISIMVYKQKQAVIISLFYIQSKLFNAGYLGQSKSISGLNYPFNR